MEHKHPNQSTLDKRIRQYLVPRKLDPAIRDVGKFEADGLLESLLSDLKSSGKQAHDPRKWDEGRLEELFGMVGSFAIDHWEGDIGTELWNMTTKLLRSESEVDIANQKTYLKHTSLTSRSIALRERAVGLLKHPDKITQGDGIPITSLSQFPGAAGGA
ncbi:hypothetical protein H072_1069 [Dactylellina haptotyla CBS 200.50]|uniref:Uncharacterized protein n=1 Tax=Dactylellina haptotyla (strain CBS 200.50) TaxID=1284197 RepID=S8CBA5_DACHA|nr:hypothetical protein H072_1069 [Dactylellina haptotyla CBS 200.50]